MLCHSNSDGTVMKHVIKKTILHSQLVARWFVVVIFSLIFCCFFLFIIYYFYTVCTSFVVNKR